MIQLKQVKTKSDWATFIDFPWTIYKGDAHWVPPLRIAVRDMLDVKKNPFFKHASLYPILAFRGRKCVGRIVGVVDENHNKYHGEKTAFFGFFESIDDQEVADALIEEVVRWAGDQKMDVLRGPMNPSTNYECGLLVEGFNDPPAVMTTYNPDYYAKLLENSGFKKAKDLYAYVISAKLAKSAERLISAAERIKKKGSVQFRPVNMKKYEEEVEHILDIYNDAWERNWGFVPMEPDEFRHLAKDMKSIIDPELCLIAEVQGEIAGFALTLPDVNQAFAKVKDGKLFPTGLLKLLWHLKGPGKKQTINRCRVITLGIKKKYLSYGIGSLLYTEYFSRAPKAGYPAGEASWILEDNKPMNKALQLMCGEKTKVYRLYDRTLV